MESVMKLIPLEECDKIVEREDATCQELMNCLYSILEYTKGVSS